MSLTKPIVVSIFLHLTLFTAALLVSANLSGGSSKISTHKAIFVDLVRDQSGIEKSGSVVRHNKSQKDTQSLHINKMKDESIKMKDKSIKTGQYRNIQLVESKDNRTIVKQIKPAKSTKDPLNDPTPDIQETRISINTSSISNDPESSLQADIQGNSLIHSDHKKNSDPRSANIALSQSSDNRNRLFIKITEIVRRYIERAKTYPLLARKRGIEGTVYVKFRINPDGQPVEIQIIRSSGSEILDKGALKIIKNAGPFPYVNDALEVPISFRLADR